MYGEAFLSLVYGVCRATAPLASSLFLLGEQPQKCMLWVPSLSALVSFTRTSKHNQVARLPEASDQELQHLGEERKGEEEVGWKTEAGDADQRCSFISCGEDLGRNRLGGRTGF